MSNLYLIQVASTKMTVSSINNYRKVSPGWQKHVQEAKEDTERAEPVVNVQGQTEVSPFNSTTHQKIILSRETVRHLVDYARDGYKFTSIEDSFDDTILDLLSCCQKKKMKRL
jgi:hypothetical protein